jgi:hypothetical protein
MDQKCHVICPKCGSKIVVNLKHYSDICRTFECQCGEGYTLAEIEDIILHSDLAALEEAINYSELKHIDITPMFEFGKFSTKTSNNGFVYSVEEIKRISSTEQYPTTMSLQEIFDRLPQLLRNLQFVNVYLSQNMDEIIEYLKYQIIIGLFEKDKINNVIVVKSSMGNFPLSNPTTYSVRVELA